MEFPEIPTPDISIPAFLSGGGEMGKRIRSHNWEETPVGSIESWPQSLRTTLSILLNSKFPMFLWWGTELIQFYNDAYRPSLGNDGKHPGALGQRGEECWPEIWPVIKPLIDQVLDGGEATWNEDQLIPIYRNGKLEDVYWTFSYSPVKDEDGKVGGVLVVCNETTEQMQNLSRITESRERFQNLVRETAVGIVVLRGEDMIVDVANEMYGRLIDRSPEELLGKPLFSIVPETEDTFRAILDNVRLKGESVYMYDSPYFVYVNGERKDGFINVIYQPYKELDGTITGVIAVCHDVTEQVRVRQKIEQAEERARLAIESAELGTYEVNLLTDEMKTSDRFNAIWGVDNAVPRTEFASYIHPDDRPLRQHAHEQSIHTGNLNYEARLMRNEGPERWVKVEGKVLYDIEGVATTLIGVIQDITEQKEFAEQLTTQVHQRTLELQRSNDDLQQFAHVASHDLKEPVRKIKVFSNRLRDEFADALPDKGKLYLDKIQNATNRIFSMIEGVLSYSALNASEQPIAAVDLNSIIKNIESDLEIVIHQKNAIIKRDDLPVIEGAYVLIYQLFYNLVNNSLKFAKADEVPVITITSSIVKQGGKDVANVMVADNGIGFDQHYAERIFNTFERLNSKDTFEGTGLGLALCKKITDRHNGSIVAESTKNEGAVFTVYLPLKQSKNYI